jgi:hypothetical protein
MSRAVGAKARNASGARELAAFLLTLPSMTVIEATGMSATRK